MAWWVIECFQYSTWLKSIRYEYKLRMFNKKKCINLLTICVMTFYNK